MNNGLVRGIATSGSMLEALCIGTILTCTCKIDVMKKVVQSLNYCVGRI